MRYSPVVQRERSEIEILLRSGEITNVLDALLSAAYYDPDWQWSQNLSLDFLGHEDLRVRRLAATCLGHIARVHKKLDLDLVLARLAPLKTDPLIGDSVRDALDDIKLFMKFQ